MRALALLLLLWTSHAAAQTPPPAQADGGTSPPAQGVLTKPPAIVRQVEAAYPPEALQQQLSGTVQLQVDISETGAVTDVQVLEPAGHGFDEAAVAAVRQFQFSPAEVDGVPAPVRITYAYQFVWREVPPAEAPASSSAKQEGPVNLSGQVFERGTRRTLANVEVGLPGLERSTSTDAEGRFAFRDVPVGEVEVVAVSSAHQRFTTKETVSAGQETRAKYYLQRRYFSPYETVVRSEREKKEVTQTSLQVAEVQRVPGTQGDTLKVVQNLPGVARPAFNGGALVIRGTSPEDSGVFLDGQRIPLLYHFGGLTSVYNSELLETVDYLPGTFSSYYGAAIGGIIDVKSRAPKSDRFHGTAGVNLLESNLVLEGPLSDTLSVAVAGRRSYIDVVLAALPESVKGDSLTAAPRYYDAQLQVDFHPKSRHSLNLQGLISNDRLGLVFKRPAEQDPSVQGNLDIRTGFKQLRLRHEYKGERLHLDTIGLVGTTLLRFDIGATRGLLIDATETNLRSSADYTLGERAVLAAGIDVRNTRAHVKAAIQMGPREGEPFRPTVTEEILTTDAIYNQYFPAAWTELRLKPLERLLLVPGFRFEAYRFTDQQHVDYTYNPRLAARYGLTDTVTLKGGVGLYFSPPQQGDPTEVFGNPELRSKRSAQLSLGSEWRPAEAWFVSGEVFYNRLTRMIVSTDATVERDGQQVPLNLDNGGVGRVYGAEVFVRRQLTERFFGWLAYTLSRSERRDQPDASYRLFDNDQTHVLTLIASYKLPRGWELGGRFRFSSGNLNTPVVGARRDDLSDVFIPIFGAVNSERVPNFHQLDVRVDKNFIHDTWTLDLYVDVTNAYNRASVEGVTYNYNYTQRAYFKGLPLLPVFGAKATF
ncbi:TonB family protein [Aggregicoccus sp. 17bor-14]|uniref:TonB-dependent receptor domain-containing protein n=1 Tax=Myxococcaceae TaxID=31 RepID=UPI00129CCDC6|nr:MULTISPECIES: TonB-dependent receptor [Myxococcaceae]MBF5043039.1 TonB-dependent receptor [Simulacricoccus sp. 17bor-14]MRI88802.1 TonB family protein [Aggregicoccus sp. 17bor-14]